VLRRGEEVILVDAVVGFGVEVRGVRTARGLVVARVHVPPLPREALGIGGGGTACQEQSAGRDGHHSHAADDVPTCGCVERHGIAPCLEGQGRLFVLRNMIRRRENYWWCPAIIARRTSLLPILPRHPTLWRKAPKSDRFSALRALRNDRRTPPNY